MKILKAVHLAQDDVTDLEIGRIDWHHRAQLSGFNLPAHGIPAGTKLNRLSSSQLVDVGSGPTHTLMRKVEMYALPDPQREPRQRNGQRLRLMTCSARSSWNTQNNNANGRQN